jgi:peptidylprolyl isomerase
LKGFVIQTGDPTGIGSGGPGYQFADEKVTRDYVTGTLAMANSGPNTNGSQFFVCLADLSNQLAKNYTIFGIVTGGMDVVQAIGNIPVKPNPNMGGEVSSPTQDVHINSVIITEQ